MARLLEELRALDRAYSVGHHGRWSAARRAGLVDARLRQLFVAAEPPGRVALVALGGYGRGELLPASDLDLLILHEEAGDSPTEPAEVAERVLYPLWDGGLSVGHGVRTADESLALAAERLDALTAMLDGRAIAGDEAMWNRLRERVLALVRSDIRGFAGRLTADVEARRERFGAATSLLEPDLKEGVGALRDAHALGWLEAALGLTLEAAGLIRTAERAGVSAAAEFLTRARSALHLQTGRATDRLLLEQQPQVAAEMGFVDEPGLPAVDGLMRQVFGHARQLDQVRAAVLDRFLGEAGAVQVEPTAEGVLRAFTAVARDGSVMPANVLDLVGSVDVTPVVWTSAVRDAFLALLRTGDVRAFETLDRLGLLERYLPAWTAVRARPQRDPYHRFPVDGHLLDAFARTARLLEEPGDDPVTARAVEVVTDHDALLLGALLHDIGKVGERDHVRAGARIAAETLQGLRLETRTRDLALFLVTEHLLLSDTATRRDLGDDDLIVDVAARVGTPERLAALYLLTVADAGATGPLAWTPWRAALVRELVAKVQRVLERGEVGADTAERLAHARDAIASRLVDEDPGAVERFLRSMPTGYLLAVGAEQAAEHFPLLVGGIGQHEVRTLSRPGPRVGTDAVTVVATDRHGLLSMIAGALTLAGLSILSAQVFTTEDGTAIDLFEVEGAFEQVVDEERWRAFRSTLRRAVEGRISLEAGVADKRAFYPPPQVEVPLRVRVDNDASDFFTVIEVGAPDRIGLLFDITRTLAELELDVHLAKVATYGVRVVDAFYVCDVLGRKLEGTERVAELERAIAERVQGRSRP